jgi:hypothetical protein
VISVPLRAAVLLGLAACRGSSTPHASDGGSTAVEEASSLVASASAPALPAPPPALVCLAEHYVGRVVSDARGWSLELPDQTKIPYDDGRSKKTVERIASPDIEDMFALPYPTGAIVPVANEEEDPGRVRVEPLFRATYGQNEREVSLALVPVKIASKTVRFHRRAAPALERVAARIDALIREEPKLERSFRELGGTFATRTIAGTDRTSAHAWGIAIDIDTSMADYWRNAPSRGWRNRIPFAVVEAFEREGFVWGGRWFHYDTMHFEYRPELFGARCRTSPLSH